MMIFQRKQRKLPSKSHTGKINFGVWQGRLGDSGMGMCCWDLESHLCQAMFSFILNVVGEVSFFFFFCNLLVIAFIIFFHTY